MKKIIVYIMLAFSISSNAQPSNTITTNQIGKIVNEFTFDIYHQTSNSGVNNVISPYSMASVLSMMLKGSAGDTRTQLLRLFHVENNMDPDQVIYALDNINTKIISQNTCGGWLRCKFDRFLEGLDISSYHDLSIDNVLWVDKSFALNKPFLNSIQEYKSIHLSQVNFSVNPAETRKTINQYIEENTNNNIHDLLPEGSVTNFTKVIVTNAIYFKGLWKHQFKTSNTELKDFTLENGRTVQAPLMNQKDKFNYTENDELQMLELTYNSSSLAMAILLPKPKHDLQEIQNKLNAALFSDLLKRLNEQDVIVTLPRFEIASIYDQLSDTLKLLGVTDAFSDHGNFTNMTMNPLMISAIIQKAMIQVNESGTTAAAATALTMFGGAPPQPIVFNANHPFIFIIFDKSTEAILFIGKLGNPAG